MSLDDLIAQKEKKSSSGGNKRKNNDAGSARGPAKKHAVRSAPYENRPRKSEAPVQKMTFRAPQVDSNEKNQNLSVFARIGKPIVSGTSVTFANLKASVVEKDIHDLSTAIGEVKEVQFLVGRSGKNTATVLFARRSDALSCVTKLNGMTLDGLPMEVSVTGEPAEFHAPKSVFDRIEPPQKNVRNGLFGTAMDSEDGSNSGGPSFSVTLGGAPETFGRQTKLVQPFHTGVQSSAIVQPFASKNTHQPAGQSQRLGRGLKEGPNFLFRDDADDQQPTRGLRQPFPQHNHKQSDRRSNGNNRGKGNQQKKESNRSAKPAPTSATDLDADLDAYFAK